MIRSAGSPPKLTGAAKTAENARMSRRIVSRVAARFWEKLPCGLDGFLSGVVLTLAITAVTGLLRTGT